MTGEPITGAAAAMAPAPDRERAGTTRSPGEAATQAIEAARAAVAEAVAGVASGDADRLARSYDVVAGCADHVARALWYLRRAEREEKTA